MGGGARHLSWLGACTAGCVQHKPRVQGQAMHVMAEAAACPHCCENHTYHPRPSVRHADPHVPACRPAQPVGCCPPAMHSTMRCATDEGRKSTLTLPSGLRTCGPRCAQSSTARAASLNPPRSPRCASCDHTHGPVAASSHSWAWGSAANSAHSPGASAGSPAWRATSSIRPTSGPCTAQARGAGLAGLARACAAPLGSLYSLRELSGT